jgi:integrase
MPIFLNVQQIYELLEIARRTSARDHAILWLMANTGLRESDLLALKRHQVLTDSGSVVQRLTVKMKKTGKSVDKTLTDQTREAIRCY